MDPSKYASSIFVPSSSINIDPVHASCRAANDAAHQVTRPETSAQKNNMTNPREAHLFINRFAGRGRAARRGVQIGHRLTQGGLNLTIVESKAPASLIDQVANACASGAQIVLVAGGDGTVAKLRRI